MGKAGLLGIIVSILGFQKELTPLGVMGGVVGGGLAHDLINDHTKPQPQKTIFNTLQYCSAPSKYKKLRAGEFVFVSTSEDDTMTQEPALVMGTVPGCQERVVVDCQYTGLHNTNELLISREIMPDIAKHENVLDDVLESNNKRKFGGASNPEMN